MRFLIVIRHEAAAAARPSARVSQTTISNDDGHSLATVSRPASASTDTQSEGWTKFTQSEVQSRDNF